ncbi:winged helix-turn-helix domain-containing protein, partial [Streptomyces sp. NPDC054919]
MANTRTFSAATAVTTAPSATAAAPPSARSVSPNRHRLRAVDPDEVVQLADVADFLPPGATWLPAPQHTLPALPGQPPMIGYLVLVPADQQPAVAGGGGPAPPPTPMKLDGGSHRTPTERATRTHASKPR